MMKNKITFIELSGLLIIMSVITSGCALKRKELTIMGTTSSIQGLKKKNELSSDKYVFIDHHIHIHGKLIEGNYMQRMIDFPTYWFDKKTKSLSGWINFDVNETLIAVNGSGTSLSGAVGGGAGTGLLGVYELPYEKYGFKILRIDSDGTAYIEYKNTSIILKSGEELVDETSRIDTQSGGKAKLTTTDKIVNYGILDKSKIKKTHSE